MNKGMNKVLIIVGDASETVDTLYPYYRLQEDGFEPVVAGPEKQRYHMVMTMANISGYGLRCF